MYIMSNRLDCNCLGFALLYSARFSSGGVHQVKTLTVLRHYYKVCALLEIKIE